MTLLTGFSFSGSWGLPCSKSFSSAKHRNPRVPRKDWNPNPCPVVPHHSLSILLEPKAATQTGLHPKVLSSWGVHLWVSVLPLPPAASLSPWAGIHCQVTPAGRARGSIWNPSAQSCSCPRGQGNFQACVQGVQGLHAVRDRVAASHQPTVGEVNLCRRSCSRLC